MSTPTEFNYDNIPQELKELKQWVCWKWGERDGKRTKLPVQWYGGALAKSTNPDHWGTFEQCYKASARYAGVGFVFTNSDYSGIDLDHCFDESGNIERWAQKIINDMDSYTEISPSGQGIHIIVKGKKPVDASCRKSKLPVEIYDNGRYFTMTGNLFPNTSGIVQPAPNELAALCNKMFGSPDTKTKSSAPVPTVDLSSLSDDDIIQKAIKAKGGKGEKFARLFAGDISDHNNDHSAADQALCNHLAFWTGRDPVRMDYLFRRSGLMRDKWDKMHGAQTYGQMTIDRAIADCQQVYTPRQKQTSSKKTLSKARSKQDGIPLDIRLTDVGNAQLLIEAYGENLRFNVNSGKWYLWRGSHWQTDDLREVDRLAEIVVKNLYDELKNLGESDVKKMLTHIKSSLSKSRLDALVYRASISKKVIITAEMMNADNWLINCKNGTIDLKTGNIRDHKRDDLISRCVSLDYDPAAQCPTWLKFLDDVFDGKSDLIKYVQKAIGYTMTGDISEQCFFMLHGNGSNGKSTLLNVISEILTDYHAKTSTDTILEQNNTGGIRNDIARLQGVRFVTAVEANASKKLATELVKELTGSDRITARFLHKEFFEFVPVFKLWLACNHKPIIDGQDNGIWRRVKMIPFVQQFNDPDGPLPHKDTKLPAKLRLEYQGIFAWMVQGCLLWQSESLGICEAVENATDDYKRSMDILSDFFDECCVLGPQFSVLSSDLFKKYQNWCTCSNMRAYTQRVFSQRLQEKGYKKEHQRNGQNWIGIGIKDEKHYSEDDSLSSEDNDCDTCDTCDSKNGISTCKNNTQEKIQILVSQESQVSQQAITTTDEVDSSLIASIESIQKAVGPYRCSKCKAEVMLTIVSNPGMAGKYSCPCGHKGIVPKPTYDKWLSANDHKNEEVF